jgi:hypothetical protein
MPVKPASQKHFPKEQIPLLLQSLGQFSFISHFSPVKPGLQKHLPNLQTPFSHLHFISISHDLPWKPGKHSQSPLDYIFILFVNTTINAVDSFI